MFLKRKNKMSVWPSATLCMESFWDVRFLEMSWLSLIRWFLKKKREREKKRNVSTFWAVGQLIRLSLSKHFALSWVHRAWGFMFLRALTKIIKNDLNSLTSEIPRSFISNVILYIRGHFIFLKGFNVCVIKPTGRTATILLSWICSSYVWSHCLTMEQLEHVIHGLWQQRALQ